MNLSLTATRLSVCLVGNRQPILTAKPQQTTRWANPNRACIGVSSLIHEGIMACRLHESCCTCRRPIFSSPGDAIWREEAHWDCSLVLEYNTPNTEVPVMREAIKERGLSKWIWKIQIPFRYLNLPGLGYEFFQIRVFQVSDFDIWTSPWLLGAPLMIRNTTNSQEHL